MDVGRSLQKCILVSSCVILLTACFANVGDNLKSITPGNTSSLEISLNSGSNITNQQNVSIEFTSSSISASSFAYALSESSCKSATNWATLSSTFALPLENQSMDIWFKIKDASDIESSCRKTSILHDGLAPDSYLDFALNFPLSGPSTSASPAIRWTNTEIKDNGPSGIQSVSSRLIRQSDSLVVADWQTITTGNSITASLDPNTKYFLEYKSTDLAGNESPISISPPFLTNFRYHFADEVRTPADFVAPGDLDNDGDIDFVVADKGADKVYWLENLGSDKFNRIEIASLGNPTQISINDFNGDGFRDFAVSANLDSKVSVFINSGKKSFTELVLNSALTNPSELSSGDIEDDGDMDIVFIYDANKIGLFVNDGSALFTFRSKTMGQSYPQGIEFFDMNKDKYMDILVALPPNKVFYFENAGDNTFTESQMTVTKNNSSSPKAGDVDDDGDIDFIVDDGGGIYLYRNNGSGVFTEETVESSFTNSAGVDLADLDGDGDLDFMIMSWTSNTIGIYRNDGTTFVNPVTLSKIQGATFLKAFDYDGDNKKEIIATGINDSHISIFKNNGSYNFEEVIVDGIGSVSSTSFDVGDINGDGLQDIVAITDEDSLVLMIKKSGGNYDKKVLAQDGYGARTVRFVNLNQDSSMDIAVLSAYDDKLTWYQNDGNLNFTTSVVATPNSGNHIEFADLDGNGTMDFVLSTAVDSALLKYSNDGSQNFTMSTIQTITNIGGFRLGFVDGDSDIDIVSFTTGVSGGVYWYENVAGSFTSRTISTTLSGINSIEITDIDKDGDRDVLVTMGTIDTLALMKNDGSENFTRNDLSTSQNKIEAVGVLDYNGDTHNDLVVMNTDDSNLEILLNDGSSNFTGGILIPIVLDSFLNKNLLCKDMDNDSKVEILFTNRSGKGLNILDFAD